MNLDDLDIDRLQAKLDQREREAAEMFAAAVGPRIPAASGRTRRGIRVFKRRGAEGGYGVSVPFPWGLYEYGYIHPRSKKYIPPKPVVRQTLLDMGDQLTAHIAGATE